MINIGIIARTKVKIPTVIMPTNITLRRYGSGYYHGMTFFANGTLGLTSNTSPSHSTTIQPASWIKDTDRTASVGSLFNVRFTTVSGGGAPSQAPTPGVLYSVASDAMFEWRWSGTPGGSFTVSVLNLAGDVLSTTTVSIA